MGRPKLSESETKYRLTRLRNLERMYRAAKEREAVKDARIAELEVVVADQGQQLDTFKIQIAELQTMVFGKKRKPPTGNATATGHDLPAAPKPPRTKDSYRRPLPTTTACLLYTSPSPRD